MIAKTKRKPKTPAEKQDSAAREREAEDSAEKKVIWVWQQFEQIYGARWSERYGNDPLGRYKDAEGNQNPRMEQWIEVCKYTHWNGLKTAVARIRDMPKPSTSSGPDYWWLPDLQIFSSQCRAQPTFAAPPIEKPRPIPTWPERACNLLLLRLIFQHGPFSEASLELMVNKMRTVKEQLKYLLEEGELPKRPKEEDYKEVQNTLMRQFSQLTIEPASDQEKEAIRERFMASRGLLQ